jgi:outer membrane receptor protein involved in Fe transport
MDFSAAGRITSYSTSGLVETWKLGLTSQVNEDVKLRTSLSFDIRAPGVGELFTNPLISTQTVTYPTGAAGQSFNVKFASPGNPNLVPEQSTTVSGGIVLTPHWVENLQLSFDWYSISIHKGIFAYAQNTIFDQCGNQHNPTFCSLVFFGQGFSATGVPVQREVDGNGVSPGLSQGLGTFSADREGAFNLYLVSPLNATNEGVSGLDFQIDYRHDLFDGSMDWHIVGNYTDQKTRTSLGQTVNGAGAVSGDGAVNPLTGLTGPKLHSTVSGTYTADPWSITAQARVIGSARLSNQYIEGVGQATIPAGYLGYVDNNGVPAVVYGDLRGSWRFNDHIQLYGAVDNVFNAPPPILATTGGGATTSCQLYDCIGRAYRVGIRFDD